MGRWRYKWLWFERIIISNTLIIFRHRNITIIMVVIVFVPAIIVLRSLESHRLMIYSTIVKSTYQTWARASNKKVFSEGQLPLLDAFHHER